MQRSTTLAKIKKIQSKLIFVALIFLGLAGNYFGLPLFSGVSFLFGSIASIVIVQLYGIFWGILGSLIISSYTYVIWHNPYSIIIFTLEVVVIGLRYHRTKNIVIIDIAYWIFAGMPLVYISYHVLMNKDITETLLIMLKDTLNGVLNVIISCFIIEQIPLRQWVLAIKRKNTIPINRMFFNLVVGCILLPVLLISIINSRNELNSILSSAQDRLKSQAVKTASMISTWQLQHINGLKDIAEYASGNVSNEDLKEHLSFIKNIYPDFRSIGIVNSKGKALVILPEYSSEGSSTSEVVISDRKYYKEAAGTLKPVISDVIVGRISSPNPTVAAVAPIIKNGRFDGLAVGGIDLDYIPQVIRMNSSLENQIITIVDGNSDVVFSTNTSLKSMQNYNPANDGAVKVIGQGMYLVSPDNKSLTDLEKWDKSYYLQEMTIGKYNSWKVMVETPLFQYEREIERYYIINLSIALVLIIAGLIAAAALSKRIIRPLSRLAQVTNHLPEKLINEENVVWPDESRVDEINSLIGNFKTTGKILSDNFNEIKNTKEELERLVYYDPLTNLPNRSLLHERLEEAIAHARASKGLLAVMFLDLDRFKLVNDTLGHAAGDELLKSVAEKLKKSLKNNQLLFRIGGDEFIILLPKIKDSHTSSKAAQGIIDIMQDSCLLNGQEFHITTSLGIAIYPKDGTDIETLLKNADMAMYRAKDKGKNSFYFYNHTINADMFEMVTMENQLRKAIEREEFVLYYQPQVNLKTGEIIGVEALVRWIKPEEGIIPPGKFIPLAEETGLIIPLGEWVLKTACKQAKAWMKTGYSPIKMAVNLSAKQFQQHNLVEKISQIIKEAELNPRLLELEITESTTIENLDFTIITLNRLKTMGISISLDDFGTGFSSLGYLKNFKIDTIKIDSSFVRDISTNAEDAAIVISIIELARNLRINVIAEGVETEEQRSLLKGYSCDYMQGYLLSKPLPAKEIEKLFNDPGDEKEN